MIILAKLSGEDQPRGIAAWAPAPGAELVERRPLQKSQRLRPNTNRRLLAEVVNQTEVERIVGKYNEAGAHGEIKGPDGKAVRGMRKQAEEGSEYWLGVDDAEAFALLTTPFPDLGTAR